MRELKFRAWDEDEGKYHYGVSISEGIAESSWGKEKPEWIIEQFTGLLDKNGKPEYQGDRVKCVMQTNSQICEGVIGWSDRYSAFVIKATTGEGLVDNLADCNEVEVIGTIHDAEYKELAK